MEKKLKIGVLGAHRGMTMIRQLLDHPDAELVAICDKYEPVFDKVRAETEKYAVKVELYTDFENFVKHDMDAVVLANYATEHAPFAIRLLNMGKHVLSEVLPCETIAQAVELIEAVEKSGKIYAYAENYCYMAATFEMWRRYDLGVLGDFMYGEGEYVHDCGSIWPGITYGEEEHWRNRMYSTFYCTHSIGPIVAITGKRPVKVSGFETIPAEWMRKLGSKSSCTGAVEMVTFEDGTLMKSLHGSLKREPGSTNYVLYGTKGMMESNRWEYEKVASYIEGKYLCQGELMHYAPEKFIAKELASKEQGHAGSDFYPTHFFIEKILGREEGLKYSIDVYQAVDMALCGIMGYRSILAGGQPMDIPDLRLPDVRDKFRNDTACTTPNVAGDQLLPVYHTGDLKIDEGTYERVKDIWLENTVADYYNIKADE